MRPLAVVMTLSLALASDTVAVQSQVRSRQAIIRGIDRGEISALVEAEQSGDRTLVPFIIAELNNGRATGPTRDIPFVTAARHAIAALADRRQLQEIWCAAVKENEVDPPVSRLGLVGGWFGIRGLQELLKPERQKNWDRAIQRRANRDGDVTHIRPRDLALVALPDTVLNPPVTLKEVDGGGTNTLLANRWNDWIAAHREELQKLAPTGEGVDYSERACKGGKPLKR